MRRKNEEEIFLVTERKYSQVNRQTGHLSRFGNHEIFKEAATRLAKKFFEMTGDTFSFGEVRMVFHKGQPKSILWVRSYKQVFPLED